MLHSLTLTESNGGKSFNWLRSIIKKPRALRAFHLVAFLITLPFFYLFCSYISTHVAKFKNDQLKHLLLSAHTVLSSCKVDFFVDNGTLLGLYRDKKIIIGDSDVDIMLPSQEDRERLVACEGVDHALAVFGIQIDRKRNLIGGLKLYDEFGLYADVDYFVEKDGELYSPSHPHCSKGMQEKDAHGSFCKHSKSSILPLKFLVFEGRSIGIPAETEKILLSKYGDTWNVPRHMDKGTDSTPGDMLKMKIIFFIDLYFTVTNAFFILWGMFGIGGVIVHFCVFVGSVVYIAVGVRMLYRALVPEKNVVDKL